MPSTYRICFIILLVSTTTTTTTIATTSNVSTDQLSLSELKLFVTSDPKNILKNGWSDSTFVCNWTGVACSGDPVRVVALNLSNSGLEGTIPPHLGNLTSLVELDLRNNSFHGIIPNELSRLKQLELINFGSNNDLSGEIPSWLGSLPKLRGLSLYGNQFSGSIPMAISNATLLKTLDLSRNRLSGLIPDEIGRLRYLETLQVFRNELKGPLPQFVFNMSSLKTLSLSRNGFHRNLPDNLCQHLSNIQELFFTHDNLSGQIPTKLSECKQLRVLSLSGNNFQGNIPQSIANLTRAREIYLAENKLTGTIPKEIGNLKNLEILNLGYNNITGVIPLALYNITTLKEISLDSNKISGSLPSDLGHRLPNLEKLYMVDNDLTGSLPKSISNASQLSLLSIGNNHFSGFIPNTITSLKNLQLLSLYDNGLKILEGTENILSKFATLSHLTFIDLSGNLLNATLPSSIGSNVSNSLEYLYFDNCNLRGHIPVSLSNFSSLIILSLIGNGLSGNIPPSIGIIQKLQGLFLIGNTLDGPIPFELCQLRFMSRIYLQNNMLSGSIPWCLGDSTSLRELVLASNKFCSKIPPTIWSLRDILVMDLSSNSLTGSLSTDIGNLKALTYFDVSSNELSGSISSSIGDLTALTNLSLSNNNFQGSIPDSMGNLLSLEHLDLSNNNLSGVIPKTFEKLSHLTFLNLSFNKLDGEIPSGGPFSNFSYMSFIQNDNLCGAWRLQVPPCKSTSNKANKALVLKWVIPSVTILAIAVVMTLLIIAFHRKNSRKSDSEAAIDTHRRVSRFELSTATNGFKDENLLGIGGFGSVYKGTLSDGLVVAIKVFNMQLDEAFESFATECEVLCNIRHRNLVRIITCCSGPDFKALVLQFMPHGSLEKWLYSDGVFLSLLQRLNIMIDVALALEYLHYGYSTPTVHCDLKPSNVLLDENMVAHVADFGMAKLLCGEDSMTQTMTLATIGYMAPEYGVGGVVSRRGDVYSFGIMLMEVFTKKRPIDEMFCEEMSLKQWVQNSIKNVIYEVVDGDLLKPEDSDYLNNKDCVTSILELALACSASSPEDRIDMKIAISELNKINKKLIRNFY